MRITGSSLAAASLAAAVALMAGASAAFRSPTDAPRVVLAERVVATPLPTPPPATPPAPGGEPPGGHPPLQNRGGGIRWVPQRDSGPWPTDGFVHLPTLGVRAPIVRVGVTLRGEMNTPRNATDVAWLDQGPFPGVTQNAVLAGHRNWSGRMGSFGRLDQLRVGDPVVVTMGGHTWTFRVVWVRLYDPDTAPVQQIMGYTEVPSVTLITCGGTFNRRTRHYEARWIARGELVSQT